MQGECKWRWPLQQDALLINRTMQCWRKWQRERGETLLSAERYDTVLRKVCMPVSSITIESKLADRRKVSSCSQSFSSAIISPQLLNCSHSKFSLFGQLPRLMKWNTCLGLQLKAVHIFPAGSSLLWSSCSTQNSANASYVKLMFTSTAI